MPEMPFVSVIMPVRNEADFIAESLGAVLAQDYPHDRMEVLIADGMSSDGTRAIISQVAAEHPDIPVTVLDNPRYIVPTGLNIALDQAAGEVIVRVDGHCKIAPDYLSRCVAHLLEDHVDGVGGPIETVAATPSGQAIAAAMSSAFGVGGSAFRTVRGQTMLVDTIAFPAYTRRAVELAGPFDEELVRNQDDEYNYRLRKLGCRLLLADDVRAEYYSRSTLRSLWRQYFQYGFWKVRVMQKHPRQMRLRQFAPPAFVLALIGGGALAPFSAAIRWGWLAMIALYVLASFIASLLAARRAGWRALPLLPIAFTLLHISYGTGFLAGLMKFANR
jgi:glycosyltransferase involved in cell wall biosynthesis